MKNVATYDREGVLFNNLNKVNLIFGSNGTGKTTVSGFMREFARFQATGEKVSDKYKDCSIEWKDGERPEIVVYNRQFKEENIGKSRIPGVFVMGKKSIEIKSQVQELDEKLADARKNFEELTKEKGTKEAGLSYGGEIYKLFIEDIDKKIVAEADALYPDALKGLKRDGANRLRRMLEVYANLEAAEILSVEDIGMKAAIVQERDAERQSMITMPDLSLLEKIESDEIWNKAVVGSGDVDFAGFINALGLSDWVRHGAEKLDSVGGICPFCQQQVDTRELARKFEGYFDDNFKRGVSKISSFGRDYKVAAFNLDGFLKNLQGNEHCDAAVLDQFVKDLGALFKRNLLLMQNKAESPSSKVDVDSGAEVYAKLRDFIAKINDGISRRNDLISQRKNLKSKMPDYVWSALVDKYKSDIDKYIAKRREVTKEVEKLTIDIVQEQNQIAVLRKTKSDLLAKSSDCSAVVERINNTLKRYQFNSFRIKKYDDSNSYCLVRSNGEMASSTLSEGEESLITFLYYIHLLNGSTNADKVSRKVIAVIDDPISSLDNNILSLVAREVKDLIFNSGNDRKNIDQVIVLTHNINFHKSLSAAPVKDDANRTQKTFFMLEKRLGSNSTWLKSQSTQDKVESEYKELWSILKRAYRKVGKVQDEDENNDYKYTVQNTLRRIYESFFSNTCGLSNNNIAQLFIKAGRDADEDDYRNFIEWINRGSHSAEMDDFNDLPSDEVISMYMESFKKTFEITGNLGQYNILMKQDK